MENAIKITVKGNEFNLSQDEFWNLFLNLQETADMLNMLQIIEYLDDDDNFTEEDHATATKNIAQIAKVYRNALDDYESCELYFQLGSSAVHSVLEHVAKLETKGEINHVEAF